MCTILLMTSAGGTTEAVWGAEGVAAVAGQSAHLCPVLLSGVCAGGTALTCKGVVQVYHPAMHQSAWSRPVSLLEAVHSGWPGACSRREASMQALLHGSRTDVAEIGLG